jgi:hypothetical protein
MMKISMLTFLLINIQNMFFLIRYKTISKYDFLTNIRIICLTNKAHPENIAVGKGSATLRQFAIIFIEYDIYVVHVLKTYVIRFKG